MQHLHKILLIDDSSVNNFLLQNILEDEGFEVLVAFSGKEGLEKAEQVMPDLVVLDLMMPRFDGFEVLRQLRSNPLTKTLPVVILTAKKDAEDEIIAKELGAIAYMNKPVDIRYTLQIIRKAMAR